MTDDFNNGITNLGSLNTQNVLTVSNGQPLGCTNGLICSTTCQTLTELYKAAINSGNNSAIQNTIQQLNSNGCTIPGTVGLTNWDPTTVWKLINNDPNNPQAGSKVTFDDGNTCLDYQPNTQNLYTSPCNKAKNWGVATGTNNVLVYNYNNTNGHNSWALDIGSNNDQLLTNVTQSSQVCLNGNTSNCSQLENPSIENSLIGTNTKLNICNGTTPVQTGVFTTGGGGCPNFMVNYCVNNWGGTDQIGSQCASYLSSGIDTKQTISDTIINYINNRPNSQNCPTNSICNQSFTNNNSDYCKERDSNDKFFTQTLSYLCENNKEACDPILSQYCFKWCRQDLQNDSTLQKICGCHMANCQGNNPCSKPQEQANLNIVNPDTNSDQYFGPNAPNKGPLPYSCDPLCRFGSTIQNDTFPSCNSTVCVMDVNNMNVTNGSTINISNLCNNNNPSDCYISTQALNVADDSKINITNNCTSCYTYDETNPSAAIKVDCNSLPGLGTSNNQNGNTIINKIINFIQNNKLTLIGILSGLFLLIFILALIF